MRRRRFRWLAVASSLAVPATLACGGPDDSAAGYLVRALPSGLVAQARGGDDAAWESADRIRWGPQPYETDFRALWCAEGLLLRFDATDPDPWHTLTRRDDPIFREEVVELFISPGPERATYAELEFSPANVVCDLWVERARNRFDKSWDAAGLTSLVLPHGGDSGRARGWTAVAFLPWRALAPQAPGAPPDAGWRFNVFRIERPGGPRAPEQGALYLAWSPTGERSFHVPAAFRPLSFEARRSLSGARDAPARSR